MSEEKFYEKVIRNDTIKEHLAKFSDLDLEKHYDFESGLQISIESASAAVEFLKKNSPLTFTISDDNTLYYTTSDDGVEEIFEIDVSRSFSKSDQWLYDKIIPVPSVFPNASSAVISNEMTSFYICLVIASVFKDEFLIEFEEVASSYDFKNWRSNSEEDLDFFTLSTNWVQIGSKYIKMVAASARYALLREKRKKQVPLALQLPEETDSELKKCLRDVEDIRYTYDVVRLSPVNREKMSRLEIRNIIKERDDAVDSRLKADSGIYQIWRLMNLNSNNIPPAILLKINRTSRRSALTLYQDIYGEKSMPQDIDSRIELKKVEDKLKRESRRAYLNKLFDAEVKKFVESPSTYTAPDFV